MHGAERTHPDTGSSAHVGVPARGAGCLVMLQRTALANHELRNDPVVAAVRETPAAAPRPGTPGGSVLLATASSLPPTLGLAPVDPR
jgi:hypothetical protein